MYIASGRGQDKHGLSQRMHVSLHVLRALVLPHFEIFGHMLPRFVICCNICPRVPMKVH